ncbi:hypothetical protein GW915_10415 [bacterium]|nr:hypothetical protein [bacterium]
MITLASWGMLFGTFVLSAGLARVRASQWPPDGIIGLDAYLPSIATLALILSSVLIHKGYMRFDKENLKEFKFYWGLGLLMGVFFLALQSYTLIDWYSKGVRVSQHLYASVIYVWIIIHGLHILGALGGLFYKFKKPKSAASLQIWGWFWHFIDLVWLAMFPLLVF